MMESIPTSRSNLKKRKGGAAHRQEKTGRALQKLIGGTRDPGGLKKGINSILETCKRQRQLDTGGNSDDNSKRQSLPSDQTIRIESPSQMIRQLHLPPREAMDSTATASDMSIPQLQLLPQVQLLPQANIEKEKNNAGKGKGKCKGKAKQRKCKGNARGRGNPTRP